MAGEKESGTLKLVLANQTRPEHRSLLAKFLGGFMRPGHPLAWLPHRA